MVPLIRYTTVSGIPLSELLNEFKIHKLVQRARNGGIEIVNLLKTGSAYYAPASASVEMTEAIVTNNKRILPCSAWLEGEYGMENVYCGVPVKLGKSGIEKIVQLHLTDEELEAFRKSAKDVELNIKKLKF
jgi:malate dehydrogenase